MPRAVREAVYYNIVRAMMLLNIFIRRPPLLALLLAMPLVAESQSNPSGSADWWMVRLTAGIVSIAAIQTIVFGLQAHRLKQTIDKMDEIAGDQTKDVRNSIAQATRAAQAMEQIATSMSQNAESVRKSVEVSEEISKTQKLISELHSRAYLTILFEGMLPPGSGVKSAIQG
jgi:hypothetical protein